MTGSIDSGRDPDIAIEGATLVTLDPDREGLVIVDDGTVAVADGRITYVGPADAFGGVPETLLDGSDRIVIPGFVDAHRHSVHAILRGGAQDLPEIEWMTHGLGPLARHVDEDDRIAGTRLAVVESLLSGVTTFGEYASEVATLVEEVYRPLGVRVAATETINEVVDDREDREVREPYAFDAAKGDRAMERAEALFDRYETESDGSASGDDTPLVTPLYGPQAVDMVAPDRLERVADRAHEHDRDVHVHVAQGRRERLQVEARYGDDASTVDVLAEAGLLDDRLIAVHCHDATTAERARLADAGARYVGCPSSIAAIDGIVPPVEGFRDHGAPVGLGTDQAPGPGGHDFLRELRTASMLAKTEATDPTALPAWRAIEAGTRGGARALGFDDLGTLSVGAPADLVALDTSHHSLAPTVSEPLHTAVPNLVYAATAGAVTDVLVDGRRVVADGDVVGLDVADVVETARRHSRAVFERASEDWRGAGSELVDRVDDGWL